MHRVMLMKWQSRYKAAKLNYLDSVFTRMFKNAFVHC